MDPIPTLHQEHLHLDTNMRDQLYMETQFFIHRDLVQYKILALSMLLPYDDSNILLPPFQIISCFGFSRSIVFSMHLDMYYV